MLPLWSVEGCKAFSPSPWGVGDSFIVVERDEFAASVSVTRGFGGSDMVRVGNGTTGLSIFAIANLSRGGLEIGFGNGEGRVSVVVKV